MTTYVISYYSLSDDFKKSISDAFGSTMAFLPLANFKHESPWRLVRRMRAMKGATVVVAIEYEEGKPLVSPLMLLASISPADRLQVFWPDRIVEEVSRFRAMRMIAALAVQVARGWISYFKYMLLAKLVDVPGHRSGLSGQGILYLDANLSFGLVAGGSVGHTRGVIDAFTRRGYGVSYLSVKRLPTSNTAAKKIELTPPDTLMYPPELAYYLYHSKFDRRARAIWGGGGYSFIYQRLSLHNFSGALLARREGVPLVVEFNGSEVWAAANWSNPIQLQHGGGASERALLRAADVVVTVSKPLLDQLLMMGVPEERIVLYPNCIDPGIFSPNRFTASQMKALRTTLQFDASDYVVAFIGTFGAWHGVEFLAKAIRKLIDDDPDYLRSKRIKFLLVGDGLKMPEVRAALTGALADEFVRFTGIVPQDEAPLLLAISSAFVSPHMPNVDGSAFFGSPTKLFEYMAMRRPIVAARLGQIGEVLSTGEGDLAYLYEPGDEAGFIESLRQMIDNPALSDMRADRAQQEVLRRYTWDAHVSQILVRLTEHGLVRPNLVN